jgi:hypothetical protein
MEPLMQISVAIKNNYGADYNIHVFDQFGGGRREVANSPFAVADGDQTPWFLVNAGANGHGTIEYSCDGGPELAGIDVTDGQVVPLR